MAGLWLRVGNVTATAGSSEITGSGTTWTDPETGPKKGQLMLIVDAAGKQWVGEVDSVSGDTALNLVGVFTGAGGAGLSYAVDSFRGNTASDLGSRIAQFLDRYNQYIREWDDRLNLIPSQLSQAQASATSAANDKAATQAARAVAEAASGSAQSSASAAATSAAQASAITGWRVSIFAPLAGLPAGGVISAFPCDRPGVMPMNLTASQFKLIPAPQANASFAVMVNHIPVATIQAADGQSTCSITPLVSHDTVLAAGDLVSITNTFSAGAEHMAATLVITH